MRITTSLASVVVSPGAAGTTILTLSDIRDIDGTRVPDGAQVGIAVADMASKDPRGSVIRSAGGAILDGTPAVNNPAFQVFGIANGRVTATYSSGAVSPGPVLGSLAVVQVQAVDSGGNVLGTEAAATLDLNLRATADQAIIEVGRSSLYADKADRRSHLQIQ